MNASLLAIALLSLASSVLAQTGPNRLLTLHRQVHAKRAALAELPGLSIVNVSSGGVLQWGNHAWPQTLQTSAFNPTEVICGDLNGNQHPDCAIAHTADVTVILDFATAAPTVVQVGQSATRLLIAGGLLFGGNGNGANLAGNGFCWNALTDNVVWTSTGTGQEGDFQTMVVHGNYLITFAPWAGPLFEGAAYIRPLATGVRTTLWTGQVSFLYPGIHDTCIQDGRLCTTTGFALAFFDIGNTGGSVTLTPDLFNVGSYTGGFYGCWPARTGDGRSVFVGAELNQVFSSYDANTGVPEPSLIQVPPNTVSSFVANFDRMGPSEVISVVNNGAGQPGQVVIDSIEPLTLQANQQVFSGGGLQVLTGNDPSAANSIYFLVTAIGWPRGPGFSLGGMHIPFPISSLFAFAGTTGYFGTVGPAGSFAGQTQVPPGLVGLPLSNFAVFYDANAGTWSKTNTQWTLFE